MGACWGAVGAPRHWGLADSQAWAAEMVLQALSAELVSLLFLGMAEQGEEPVGRVGTGVCTCLHVARPAPLLTLQVAVASVQIRLHIHTKPLGGTGHLRSWAMRLHTLCQCHHAAQNLGLLASLLV